MEDQTSLIEPLLERAEVYGKTSYALFKLKLIDKTADLASTLISRGAAILFFIFFLLSANIGTSLWLGDLLGKSYYGFFCIAGFNGFVGVILYFIVHTQLKHKVGNAMVTQMLQ
jgi:hypothetical protein